MCIKLNCVWSGEMEGVQDVVEMLYGGEVELNERNYKTVLKFSVVYNVQEMYKLCMDWVTGHLAKLDLYRLIAFGLIIERLGQGNKDLLNLSIGFIRDVVKDELKVLGKDWLIGGNINMFKFLINEDILDYTLPVLSDNISVNVSDGIISTILTQLEGIAESFWKYGERSSELLEKMSEVVEVPATMRRLMKLSNLTNRKLGENSQSGLPQCSVPGLNRLLAEDYRLFSLDKVVEIETEFDLTHIEFVEIVIEWIRSNTPTQDKVTQLWGMFRQQELCWLYLDRLRYTVCRSGPVSVPKVEQLDDDKYKYWHSGTTLYKGDDLSSIKLDRKCEKCKKDLYSVTVRLVEGTPCYEVEAGDAHVVEHVCLVYIKDGYYHLSVLTNSYSDVVEQINECWREGDYIALCVMYTCTAE